MRTVTLEEHVIFPEMVKEIREQRPSYDFESGSPAIKSLSGKLEDIGEQRLKSMDDNGISCQVLSVVGPGADLVFGKDGLRIASKYNDLLAERIAPYAGRFSAFAHLPMQIPSRAADELQRVVSQYHFRGALINGLTNEKFLDDPSYDPLFERAQALNVPLYLHPGLPPKTVQAAYFSDLPKQAGQILSVAGWGWHAETALHILRLIVSGTFDRFPSLKIIIGHMGEMLPMMMARCDTMFKPGSSGENKRSISDTLKDQVYITTSGLFTFPPLQIAIDTFGIDRILFSVDYPFSNNETGRQFLDALPLEKKAIEKVAFRNADRILKLA